MKNNAAVYVPTSMQAMPGAAQTMPATIKKDSWQRVWQSAYRRRQTIAGTVIMLSLVFVMPLFFGYIEKRKGFVLHDWLLAAIPPHNVSVAIFAVIWGMVIFTFIRAVYTPKIYITYCWTLIFVSLCRFLAITLVPLAPPIGLIPLTDPLTGVFYGQALITKDLFFSGHTATLTLMFLCLERKTDKVIGFFAIITVAILLLVQHIHYTIDILVAPIVTYVFFRLTKHFLYKNEKEGNKLYPF